MAKKKWFIQFRAAKFNDPGFTIGCGYFYNRAIIQTDDGAYNPEAVKSKIKEKFSQEWESLSKDKGEYVDPNSIVIERFRRARFPSKGNADIIPFKPILRIQAS